jgi:hypothetical protein
LVDIHAGHRTLHTHRYRRGAPTWVSGDLRNIVEKSRQFLGLHRGRRLMLAATLQWDNRFYLVPESLAVFATDITARKHSVLPQKQRSSGVRIP